MCIRDRAAVSMIAASIYQIVRTVKDGKNIETINKKSDTINTAISDTGTKIYSDTQNIRAVSYTHLLYL